MPERQRSAGCPLIRSELEHSCSARGASHPSYTPGTYQSYTVSRLKLAELRYTMTKDTYSRSDFT